ncbi:MAG: Hsp20/alpha crystallin family protein [Deinococcota bacterium]|jgi:HSP20 family protein|nr:Hsp20/alpha crystallin family protein [Deinococcota bacterium]
MANRNPWQELEEVQRQLYRALQGRGADEEGISSWVPATDVIDDEDGLHFYLDLPGVQRDSLEVSTEQSTLNVKASRVYEESGSQTTHRQERPQGSFSRSFNVPANYDLEAIEASYEGGVLHLKVPRSAVAKPRKIEVQVGS